MRTDKIVSPGPVIGRPDIIMATRFLRQGKQIKEDKMAMTVHANVQLPSMTAQDVGRELYHNRQNEVRVMGDKNTLKKIIWILQGLPDMVTVQPQPSLLIVRLAQKQVDIYWAMDVETGTAIPALAPDHVDGELIVHCQAA
jgi:hypothetical protein